MIPSLDGTWPQPSKLGEPFTCWARCATVSTAGFEACGTCGLVQREGLTLSLHSGCLAPFWWGFCLLSVPGELPLILSLLCSALFFSRLVNCPILPFVDSQSTFLPLQQNTFSNPDSAPSYLKLLQTNKQTHIKIVTLTNNKPQN